MNAGAAREKGVRALRCARASSATAAQSNLAAILRNTSPQAMGRRPPGGGCRPRVASVGSAVALR
jgi:hypothetical protein